MASVSSSQPLGEHVKSNSVIWGNGIVAKIQLAYIRAKFQLLMPGQAVEHVRLHARAKPLIIARLAITASKSLALAASQ